MEVLSADIYRELSNLFPGTLFPGENYLFTTLADSEDRHAFIVKLGVRIDEINKMHDIIEEDIMCHINAASDFAKDIRSNIKPEKTSLSKILLRLIEMEESIAEIYLQDLMRMKTKPKGLSYIQKFYIDEKYHAEMIKNFMKKKGYS
jgi:hypothetical protein